MKIVKKKVEKRENIKKDKAGIKTARSMEQMKAEPDFRNQICDFCDEFKSHINLMCCYAFHEQCLGKFIATLGNKSPICPQVI